MLTQQQADDYNIWQHELEAIEIWQNMAQKQINSYVDAMSKVSDMMATATPEMMNRIRLVVPRLIEGYNNAKLKMSSYEDRHQQALSKVNEYKALEAQQTVQPTVKRRTVDNNNEFDWNTRWNNEYKNSEQPVATPTTNPTSYRNNPLYPEFQKFISRRNNKNNAYKTDPLYPEFQEFLNWRNNSRPTSVNNTWWNINYNLFRPNTNRFSLYN